VKYAALVAFARTKSVKQMRYASRFRAAKYLSPFYGMPLADNTSVTDV
jgi:hypothetical protein